MAAALVCAHAAAVAARVRPAYAGPLEAVVNPAGPGPNGLARTPPMGEAFDAAPVPAVPVPNAGGLGPRAAMPRLPGKIAVCRCWREYLLCHLLHAPPLPYQPRSCPEGKVRRPVMRLLADARVDLCMRVCARARACDRACDRACACACAGACACACVHQPGWMSWEIFRCETNCTKYPDKCINAALYTEMADHVANDGYLAAGYSSELCPPPHTTHAAAESTPDTAPASPASPPSGGHMHTRHSTQHAAGTRPCPCSDGGGRRCLPHDAHVHAPARPRLHCLQASASTTAGRRLARRGTRSKAPPRASPME